MDRNSKGKCKAGQVWSSLWKMQGRMPESGKAWEKKAAVIPAVCISVLLTACGLSGQPGPTGDSNRDPAMSAEVSSGVSAGAFSETPSEAASGALSSERQEANVQWGISEYAELPQPYAKYLEVLEQIMAEGRDPNGREYYSDENYRNFENNCFAVLDVDGDGRQELVFNFNESTTGSMREVVYEYDQETDTLWEELADWVNTEYYPGGLVKVQWSHNHGRDPSERGGWPYDLYRYDPEENRYQLLYVVDAWDGQIYEKDFPYDLDADGDKLVYRITVKNEEPTAVCLTVPRRK